MSPEKEFALTKIEECLDKIDNKEMKANDYLKNHWLLILEDSYGEFAQGLKKRVERL